MPKRKLEESASSALADGKTGKADMQRALAAREQQVAAREQQVAAREQKVAVREQQALARLKADADSKDKPAVVGETLDPCVADNKDEWRQIYIRFKRPGYDTMCYSTNKHAKMQMLMNIYCTYQGLDASATNFSASATNSSEKLKPSETFEEAGVTNGCELHVFA